MGFSKHFVIPPCLCSKLSLKALSQQRGLQSAVSPPVDPGQSPGGEPRGKAPRSSAYLGSENLLI